ncbi:hypothetical protein BGW41_006159 [Actinomortierella wolfii]|nr:hypothetical protein BGW41_006159 [Actinomortierella wolfii]
MDLMELTIAAEQLDVIAMVNLASRFENGIGGVTQNDRYAFYWYERAARRGHVEAKCRTADMLSYGDGVPRNDKEAAFWYYEAALDGDPWAQNEVGYLYDEGGRGFEQDDRAAVYWYRLSALGGHPCGQFNLANMYHDGRGVGQRDYVAAVYWFRQAADQGDAVAQNNLAWMYDAGRGIEQDDERAYYWSCRSAEGGCKEAQCAVGIMNELGVGVSHTNVEAAIAWYRRAVDTGEPSAAMHLRVVEAKLRDMTAAAKSSTTTATTTTTSTSDAASTEPLTPSQIEAAAQANGFDHVRWYQHMAELGEPAASYNLASIYEKGIGGTAKDLSLALMWFKKASEQGHPNAELRWQCLKEDMEVISST